MIAMPTYSRFTDLHHAINEIQSEWSPRERARRSRLAELRQRRLAQMLSPLPRAEAYDCQCDLDIEFGSSATGDSEGAVRSQRYVLIGD
jgi:hypothetical protein